MIYYAAIFWKLCFSFLTIRQLCFSIKTDCFGKISRKKNYKWKCEFFFIFSFIMLTFSYFQYFLLYYYSAIYRNLLAQLFPPAHKNLPSWTHFARKPHFKVCNRLVFINFLCLGIYVHYDFFNARVYNVNIIINNIFPVKSLKYFDKKLILLLIYATYLYSFSFFVNKIVRRMSLCI